MTRHPSPRYISELRDLVHDGRWGQALVGAASSPLGMGYVLGQPQQPTASEAPLYVALRDALVRPEHVYRLPLDQLALWSELGHQLWCGLSGQTDVDPAALLHACLRWWGAARVDVLAVVWWWACAAAVDLDVDHRPPGGLGETQEEIQRRDAAHSTATAHLVTALEAVTGREWGGAMQPTRPVYAASTLWVEGADVHPTRYGLALYRAGRRAATVYHDTKVGWYASSPSDDPRMTPPTDPHLASHIELGATPGAYLRFAETLLRHCGFGTQPQQEAAP